MSYQPTLLLLVLIASVAQAAAPMIESPVILNDAAAGAKLAADLRQAVAEEKVEWRGVLKVKPAGQPSRQADLAFVTRPGTPDWKTFYELRSTNSPDVVTCYLITRQPGASNQYGVFPGALPAWRPELTQAASMATGLGFSDYTLGDLGMEFLFWPQQVLVKNEMKRSRLCRVLASVNPQGDGLLGYGRVVSWIDAETGGILQAEACSSAGKLVKEFKLNSFKKVSGQWQLEEMEMLHPAAKSRTLLKFLFDEP